MKKVIIFLILLFLPITVNAKAVDVYLFYGKECAYCHNEQEYLKVLEKQYNDNINIHKHEVWHNQKNAKLLLQVKKTLKDKNEGVPYTVIGDKSIIGYNEKIAKEIRKTVNENLIVSKENVIKQEKTSKNEELYLPILGNINVKNTPVILSVLLLALGTVFSLNSLWLILFCTSAFKEHKKVTSVLFLLAAAVIYALCIFDVIHLNNLLQMSIKTFISIIPIILVGLNLKKLITPSVKKSNKIILYMLAILSGLLSGFIFYNYYGVADLLNIVLEINNSSALYFIIYILFYIIISLLLIFIFDKLIRHMPHQNIIKLVILLIISIVLIFFPKLFMFMNI